MIVARVATWTISNVPLCSLQDPPEVAGKSISNGEELVSYGHTGLRKSKLK